MIARRSVSRKLLRVYVFSNESVYPTTMEIPKSSGFFAQIERNVFGLTGYCLLDMSRGKVDNAGGKHNRT